jgi:hypothetical protein
MDVVNAYLYGSLDSNIYMKVPDGIPILNTHVNHNMYCVKLVVIVWLKTIGNNVVQTLKEFLRNKGYSNNDDCPCVFIRKSTTIFCIISVYVDDLNIIGHTKDIDEAQDHLNTEFKMKDLGRIKFFIGLQLEHIQTGILMHQSIYVQKILKKFNMDKAYSARTPTVVRALEKNADPFMPKGRRRRGVRIRIHIPKCH